MPEYNNFNSRTYSKDNQNQRKEAQYISRIKFSDKDNNLSLNFKYWKGMLVFEIDKVSQNNGSWKFDEIIHAHFNPYKARVMASELDKFKKDPKSNPVGMALGSDSVVSCVTFIYVDKIPTLVMCHLNPDGSKDDEVWFTLNDDQYFSLNYSNYEKMDCEQIKHPKLILDIIQAMLWQFSDAMIGGYSYSVMDMGRFNDARINNKLNTLMSHFNIEYGSSNGNGVFKGNKGENYFNKNNAAAYDKPKKATSESIEVDDIAELLD